MKEVEGKKKRRSYSVPADKLESAKALYLAYEPLSEIARKLNVSKTSLHYHAQRYWNQEREMLKAELFQTMTEAKKTQFTSMTASTIKIMERALHELSRREKPPTILEAAKASEIMATLDKITRLDEDQPTDIISSREKPITVEALRKKLALDPFAEVEDVEFKQLEEPNDPTDAN